MKETGFERGDKDCLHGVPNHPVQYVSWHEALGYCEWLTGKLREWEETPEPLAGLLRSGGESGRTWLVTLPSEAEWEKAARGQEGRIYPWGNEFDRERGNFAMNVGRTSAVGCFPAGAGPYGSQDMSGNVDEWTRSLWGKGFSEPDYKYPYDPTDGRENLEAPGDVLRVVRGGAFSDGQNYVRCAYRYGLIPGYWFNLRGFRVVLSPLL